MALIHLENVDVAYGSPARPILEGIDLEIEQGEFVAVLGRTGCGKSTLLRLLLSAERPTNGRVVIDGREHQQPDRSRGYVPQQYGLFPDRTVLDNIMFGPEVSRFSLLGRLTPGFYRYRRELRAQALDYMLGAGLRESDAGKYPHQLSGGMQQRVAIVQALMTEPPILLMDEPFSALDPGTRRKMQQMVRHMWQSTGTTVLFVTHNTQEALGMGGRVIVLAKDSHDQGSRVALDLKVPDGARDDDNHMLVRCLEHASEGTRTEFSRSMKVKRTFALASLGVCLSLSIVAAQARVGDPSSESEPSQQARPGVSIRGVRREMSAIKPVAVFPVKGSPDWQVVTDDAVWVTSAKTNTVHRLEAKTNKVAATVEVGKKPCSGLAAGFGSIWVPNCTDQTISRIDIKTNKVIATVAVGPAASEGGIAANADSIWILSDPKGLLSRIDPATNRVVADIQMPAGSVVCLVGEDGAIWAVSPETSLVTRVDPATNLVTDRIEVGPQPRFATSGGGSIWTLNQGDGSVSRVDVKMRKLVTDIPLGIPGSGGEITYGEGYVWVTIMQVPLTQIDPNTNKVIKQWFGEGGDAVRVGHGSLWLSNGRQQNVWRIDPKQL
jgi:YVTN family beta-propeller protein